MRLGRSWPSRIVRLLCLLPGLLLGFGQFGWADCSPDKIILRGPCGVAMFQVEIADTKAKRALGLMHRDHLDQRAGMLFLYPFPQPVSFWMRNTFISLDILFVDQTGTVQQVHHNAKPLDETPIFGGNQVFAVLEINAGLAFNHGLDTGTELQSIWFPQKTAAWPCGK